MTLQDVALLSFGGVIGFIIGLYIVDAIAKHFDDGVNNRD